MQTYVITIGREFGSSGCEIGQRLAEKLNIRYYDREILELAAKDMGYLSRMPPMWRKPSINARRIFLPSSATTASIWHPTS